MKKTIWDKRLNLKEQGFSEHIWKITECDEVIDELLGENRVILGGEILKKKAGEYVYDGSGWFYNGDSCLESAKRAKEYFASWAPDDDLAVIFVFTPDKETEQ